MIYWGMSGGHDATVSIFHDNLLIDSFRYNNIKDIEKANRIARPQKVVWFENPYLKSLRQMFAGQPNFISRNNVSKILKDLDIKCPWTYVSHHGSHAAAFYQTDFREALIFVMDSIGEYNCTSVWQGNSKALYMGHRENKLKLLGKQNYPDSLGLFYSAMVKAAGLTPNQDESIFESIVHESNFNRYLYRDIWEMIIPHMWRPIFNQNFHRGVGSKFSNYNQQEIAATTQRVFEELVLKMCNYWINKTGINNIILSGGCAFNRGIRPKIKAISSNLWIPENPGDSGSSIGCVLKHLKTKIKEK
jgi:carbamoyltransferase|tara:strand:+ start:467 stop:1375 length:909 start_codon:yes stop_codon:yes gene_type:complete